MSGVNLFLLMQQNGDEKIVARGEIDEKTIKENGRIYIKCKGCGKETEKLLKDIRCYGNYFLKFKCPHCDRTFKVHFYTAAKKIYNAIIKVYD